MKSYATIELYNAATGELEKTITKEGIVTDAPMYLGMLGYPYLGALTMTARIFQLWNAADRVAAGLSLFDINLDTDNHQRIRQTFDEQDHKVAWGDNRDMVNTSGSVPERGNFLDREAKFERDSFEFVWEFDANQGNTTFRSLALTNPAAAGPCGGSGSPSDADLDKLKQYGYDYVTLRQFTDTSITAYNQKKYYFDENYGTIPRCGEDLTYWFNKNNGFSPFVYSVDEDTMVEGYIAGRTDLGGGTWRIGIYYHKFNTSEALSRYFPTAFTSGIDRIGNTWNTDFRIFDYSSGSLNTFEYTEIEVEMLNGPRENTSVRGLRSVENDSVFIVEDYFSWQRGTTIARVSGYPPRLESTYDIPRTDETDSLLNVLNYATTYYLPDDFGILVDKNWNFWCLGNFDGDVKLQRFSSLATVQSELNLSNINNEFRNYYSSGSHLGLYKAFGYKNRNVGRIFVDYGWRDQNPALMVDIDLDEMKIIGWWIVPKNNIYTIETVYSEEENLMDINMSVEHGLESLHLNSYFYTKLNFGEDITKTSNQRMKVKVRVTDEPSGREILQ